MVNTTNHCPHCNAPISYMVGPAGKTIAVNTADDSPHVCSNEAQENKAHSEPTNQTEAPGVSPVRVVHPSISVSDSVIRNALAIRDLANRISSGEPVTLAERMSA